MAEFHKFVIIRFTKTVYKILDLNILYDLFGHSPLE